MTCTALLSQLAELTLIGPNIFLWLLSVFFPADIVAFLFAGKVLALVRRNARSTLVTGRLPIAHSHGYLVDPTLVDTILDSVAHRA